MTEHLSDWAPSDSGTPFDEDSFDELDGVCYLAAPCTAHLGVTS